VPKEFRNDIQVVVGSQNLRAGKISSQAMAKILSAKRTHRLTMEQQRILFQAAKRPDFQPQNVGKYAAKIKQGVTNFIESTDHVKYVRLDYSISQKEWDRLWSKHIDGGHFKSMSELFRAILSGKKSETVRFAEKEND
jgi:hypothetical protein